MYASVTSSLVCKSGVVHSGGCLSRSSCVQITEMTTSQCLIEWTVQTHLFFNHGGLSLQKVMNWPLSSVETPAGYYIFTRRPSTLRWIYSHPIVRYRLFLLVPVLKNILKWVYLVIFGVGTFRSLGWLTGVCVGIGSQWVAYKRIRHSSVCSIVIHWKLGKMSLEPWFSSVEKERKIIPESSGKSHQIHC